MQPEHAYTAEVAGLALGSAKSRGPEYEARGQAVAEQCRMAGAGEALIPQWTEEGRQRTEDAKLPPFAGRVVHHADLEHLRPCRLKAWHLLRRSIQGRVA